MGMMFLKEKTPIGYYFKRCHSIHTFFCHFPIDVVLLNRDNEITKIKRNLKPWRIYFFSCYSIIEFFPGYLPEKIEKDFFIDQL